MIPFEPLFRNPHLQTFAGHFWPRPEISIRFPAQLRKIETEPGVRIVVESQAPGERPRGRMILVHGLEGSSDASYMVSLAGAALQAGYATHRMNIRGCGAGASGLQTKSFYHAGLTHDLHQLMLDVGPAYLVGFSLGANIVLKLAGELGKTDLIRGVCGISSPLDLEACSRRIGERDNHVYEQRFVRRMKRRLLSSGHYGTQDLSRLRSVFDIDDAITAPSFGFGDALNYYRTQSAIRYLDAIRVPTLLIQAKDDTFIPFDIFDSPAVRANPPIMLLATEYGGHLGFLGKSPHRFWADDAVMEWISRT